MRYTPEQYNQKYATLNEKLTSFISSEDTDAVIAAIAKRNKLSLEAWRNLGSEIGYVFVGLEPMSKFIDNVKQYVGVDEATALKITKDVEEEVFVPFEDLNLPATQAQAPEREVAVRKILTPNPILNKQLEVPVVNPLNLSDKPIKEVSAAPQQAPTLQKPGEPSIVGARLGGSINLPHEEVKISPPSPAPQAPKYDKDPYRESIE